MKNLIINNKSTYTGIATLVLRIVFGLTMLFGHGLAKWGYLFSNTEIQFLDPFGIGMTASLGLAVFAEVICSLLLILGLVTRLALLPLIITMLVAFNHHLAEDFAALEKSILYLVVYVTLFIQGAGKYSLDNLLSKTSK